jgi:phosphate uptake regulator
MVKRKVNLVGQKTLTISLPSEWAKHYGIRKGDELSVEVNGPSLEVLALARPAGDEVVIDSSELNRTTLVSYVRYHYRNGASTIMIKCKEPHIQNIRDNKQVKVASIINEETNRLMGMEIIEQKNNHIVLKSMLYENMDDFDTFLRKIFFLLKESYDVIIDVAINNESAEQLLSNHDSATRFINYCDRLLNKYGYKNYRKTLFLHSMLESLETMVDLFEDLARKLQYMNLSKEIVPLIQEQKEFFENFTSFYYDFSLVKATALNIKRIGIEERVRKTSLSNEENIILCQLSVIPTILIRSNIGVRIGLET